MNIKQSFLCLANHLVPPFAFSYYDQLLNAQQNSRSIWNSCLVFPSIQNRSSSCPQGCQLEGSLTFSMEQEIDRPQTAFSLESLQCCACLGFAQLQFDTKLSVVILICEDSCQIAELLECTLECTSFSGSWQQLINLFVHSWTQCEYWRGGIFESCLSSREVSGCCTGDFFDSISWKASKRRYVLVWSLGMIPCRAHRAN